MYYISSGQVKLMRHTSEGDTVNLYVGTSREKIAEASLFSESYHCAAMVDQPSEIYTIDRDTALAEIFNSPRNSREILKLFSGKIGDLRGLIEIRNIRSAQT
jgi:CRP-like cAMP-binding protein